MSKVQTVYTTGPGHFDAQAFRIGFTGAMLQLGVPLASTIDEAKENDPGYKNSAMVMITFEVVDPDEDAPAHEHLKEQSE